MLSSVQFLYIDDSFALPAEFINCGHASVDSIRYRWDGCNRWDCKFQKMAIWQYTVSGCGAIDIGDKQYLLKPGMAFLVTVPDDHVYYMPFCADHWEFVYLTATGSGIIELTEKLQQKFGKVLNHGRSSAVVRKTLDYINMYKDQPLPDRFTASGMAYEMWITLAGELNAAQDLNSVSLLEQVSDYLRKNLQNVPSDVAELASAVGLSRAHFTRKFAAEYGVSPGKFLLEWRLRMAAQLLGTEHGLVKQVAYQTGFTDVSHFCRVFRKKYLVSPKVFRSMPAETRSNYLQQAEQNGNDSHKDTAEK